MLHICHCWCILSAKESSWRIYVTFNCEPYLCVHIYPTNLWVWDTRFDIVYTITDGLCVDRTVCEETNTRQKKSHTHTPTRIQYAYLSSGKNSGNEPVVECVLWYPQMMEIGTVAEKPGKRLCVSNTLLSGASEEKKGIHRNRMHAKHYKSLFIRVRVSRHFTLYLVHFASLYGSGKCTHFKVERITFAMVFNWCSSSCTIFPFASFLAAHLL